MARYDDLDTKSIALTTVISSIVLVVLILAGRAFAYTLQNIAEEKQTSTAKYAISDQEIADQKAVLTKSGAVQDPPANEGDKPVDRTVLPIEKAQQLIGKELSTQPKT